MAEGAEMTLDEALEHLEKGSDALSITVQDTIPQIRDALPTDEAVHGSAPSRPAVAEMVLDSVKEKVEEVETAVEIVEEALWEHP